MLVHAVWRQSSLASVAPLAGQASMYTCAAREALLYCTRGVAGESDTGSEAPEEEASESSDSEDARQWRPQSGGRCAVCKRAKKGRCGTDTAPVRYAPDGRPCG